MKKLTALFLFVSILGYAQTNQIDKIINVTSVKYTADDVEDLESIDWDYIEEAFENNNEEENIELTVAINFKESKNKFKSSFTVRDKSKNLERFITRGKKGVKSLIKISKKHKN